MPFLALLPGLLPCSCDARLGALRWLPLALVLTLIATTAPHAQAQHESQQRAAPHWRVAILVYPGVELLDFSGPGEVFAATMVGGRHPFEVMTVAASKAPLVSQGFLTITPTHDLASCPQPDILVLPGGNVPLDPDTVAWVRRVAVDAEVTMSVCNGALLAGAAGLLDGLHVTTHRSALLSLALGHPSVTVHPELRLVDSGHVLTTGGVSAGIDGALALVARLIGHDEARSVADYMEYRWTPEDSSSPVDGDLGAETLAAGSALVHSLTVDGAAAGLELYRDQLATLLDEATLNRMGYAFLRPGSDSTLGVSLLSLTATVFPRSPNARDSLSEALVLIGRHAEAAQQARECLRLLDEAGEHGSAEAERLRTLAEQRLADLSRSGGE